MSRYVRFFIMPSDELRTIEDKLYDDPTAIMDAEEIWQEYLSYLVSHACLKVEFKVLGEADNQDEATRKIELISMEVNGDTCLILDDEKQGVDAELMSTLVEDELRCIYTQDEIAELSYHDTTNETLKRFGLI